MGYDLELEVVDKTTRDIGTSDVRQAGCLQESFLVSPDYEKRIYQLWDELSDFDRADTDHVLIHCMRSIADMINAQNVYWIGSVRMFDGNEASGDIMLGWRPKALKTLLIPLNARERASNYSADDPGTTTLAALENSGEFRYYSLGSGFVDLKAFEKTGHYDFFYRQSGISDRIWVIFPLSEDSESYFVIDTMEEGRTFTIEEIAIAAKVLRGIKWFHRQLFLSHGVGICETPLTPSEQRMVSELIAGGSEKAIAENLGLTPATVHQYATKVYRKYGVRGRAEFMALWLRRW